MTSQPPNSDATTDMPETAAPAAAAETELSTAPAPAPAPAEQSAPVAAATLPPSPSGEPVSAVAPPLEPVEPPVPQASPVLSEPQAPQALPEPPAASPADSELDFASMLEDFSPPTATFERGQQVTGTIVRVGAGHVFVDLGAKQEGVIDAIELHDEDGELMVKVGQELTAVVLDPESSEGGIRLVRRMGAGLIDNAALQEAYASKIPIEGRVEKTIKGGFEVKIAGQRAFCPISQIEIGRTEDGEAHVGQTYDFLITELADRKFVVSRTALLDRARKEARDRLKGQLRVGQVLEGAITKLRDFGAFVDLGGIEGLVHVSEMSWGRVDNPAEIAKPGDMVKVEILKLDWGQQDRISLSMKKAQSDPWVGVSDRYQVGERARGIVARLTDYGAFVELEPGIDGLVHISEMSWTRRLRHPSDVLTVGETVEVAILSVDLGAKRISLGMKQAMGNPWEDALEKFPANSEVTGVIARIADFGVFVDLEGGITALLPASESNTDRRVPLARSFQIGDELVARVLEVRPQDQRLTLTRKEEGGSSASYNDQQEGAAPRTGGRGREDGRRDDGRRDDGRRGGPGGRGGRDRDRDRGSVPAPKERLGTFADLLGDKLADLRRGLDD